MLKNMTIKGKLSILTAISAIGLIILIILNQLAIKTAHNLGEAKAQIELLDIHMLELRKDEKDFLARKDLKYVESFKKIAKEIIENKKELQYLLEAEGVELSNVEEFIKSITDYENKFFDLAKLQQNIGLNHKDGLYGSLRASVHKVQEYAKSSGDMTLLASVYDLRKQEKDFMLRFDTKYVNAFVDKHSKLMNYKLSDNARMYLGNYKRDFLALVEMEKKKGLDADSGLLGELNRSVEKTAKLIHQIEDEIDVAIEEKTNFVVIFDLVVALVIMLVIISFILIIAKDIVSSIKLFQNDLTNFFDYLNRKTTKMDPIKITSDDEIGVMSKEINENIAFIKKSMEDDMKVMGEIVITLDKVEQGIYGCKIRSNTQNPMVSTLRNTINKMLTSVDENMSQLRKVLEEYANDDFRNKIDINPRLKADMLAVLKSVTALGEALADSAKANLENGQTLESNALTMNQSVQNVAHKANEQAASLEETAAAVEEITSITRNNAENASKMANLGSTVKSAVTTGQGLATKTATSMDEINTEVNAINEAITVIDQIAFQTNILSLNAAVEAATAGEAGKGFAVVAQEVRNLAGRSAEAAKEIKDLVETARSKADDGKKISDEMIKGYEELNTHISETINIIGDVSNASKEQMSGIEQINDAVTMLDRVTQENASEANSVSGIASQVASLAEELVSDAASKEFIGKNEISAQKASIQRSAPISKTVASKPSPKASPSKMQTKPAVNKAAPISSQTSGDDEWESF